jgi:hypothetical protein
LSGFGRYEDVKDKGWVVDPAFLAYNLRSKLCRYALADNDFIRNSVSSQSAISSIFFTSLTKKSPMKHVKNVQMSGVGLET